MRSVSHVNRHEALLPESRVLVRSEWMTVLVRGLAGVSEVGTCKEDDLRC